ncbi:hypothetical protein CATMIT_01584, partial [Catenibacterium mitsuokai DSM 15897]
MRLRATGSRIRERQGALRPGRGAKSSALRCSTKFCSDEALDPRLRGDDGLGVMSVAGKSVAGKAADASRLRRFRKKTAAPASALRPSQKL